MHTTEADRREREDIRVDEPVSTDANEGSGDLQAEADDDGIEPASQFVGMLIRTAARRSRDLSKRP